MFIISDDSDNVEPIIFYKRKRIMTNYYQNENAKLMNNYIKTVTEITKIHELTDKSSDKYDQFFNGIATKIISFCHLEKELLENANYFDEKTFEELHEQNQGFYAEILPKNYSSCYANPAYSAQIFGEEIGVMLSGFYSDYRQYPNYAFQHRIYMMKKHNQLFIDVYQLFKNKHGAVEAVDLKSLISRINANPTLEDETIQFKQGYDPSFRFFLDIIENSDLSDLRYLLKYGDYISENEIRIAKFMQTIQQFKINKIATVFCKAFTQGLKNKRVKLKSTIRLYFPIGYERIALAIIKYFKAENVEILINDMITTSTNRQYWYDHRFDHTLYFDKDYCNKYLKILKETYEANKVLAGKFSGYMYFEAFGEKPFNPEIKPVCLKLSEDQIQLENAFDNECIEIHEKYIPASETSYSMIAFPSPEIGTNFEAVFEDMLDINSLDSNKYELIQQKMIDVLDQADYVHIKGKGSNQTDIKVKMHTLKNPDQETNFNNYVADENIPVGEVYTSPQLSGTNGLLHIEEAFLLSYHYQNLKLHFKDGFISEYSCNNQENEKDTNSYIFENLMEQHETLPLGEFAIGTNTLAYVKAKKHKIMHLLPELVLEKMGPHFAIGDTCFSWDEDTPLFNNINSKRLTAVENEKTALRKKNTNDAYTNVHTDITLPYESIEFITAATKDGEKTDIIRNCRFVLPGTEELNIPLEEQS